MITGRLCRMVLLGLVPMAAFAETAYLDVNLVPGRDELDRRYHYSTESVPDAQGVHSIPVLDDAGALVVTLENLGPLIKNGSLTGAQHVVAGNMYLVGRMIAGIGEGYTGRAVMRDDAGFILHEVPYVDGKRDGTEQAFFEDGAQRKVTHYDDGQKVLTDRLWDGDGQLRRETERQADGTFVRERERTSDGTLHQETVPYDIPRHGPGLQQTTWELGEVQTFVAAGVSDPDQGFTRGADHPYKLLKTERGGTIIDRSETINGTYTGLHVMSRSYDDLRMQAHMVKGKRHGPYLETKGGRVLSQGSYDKGERIGSWMETTSDGEVVRETYIKAGVLSGARTVHAAQGGQLRLREIYTDGLLDGAYVRFDETGQRLSSGTYMHGKKTGQWSEADDAAGSWRGAYEDDKRQGRWVRHNADGYVIEIATMSNGELNGPHYRFARDGALELFENWKNGVRQGARVVYEDGKPLDPHVQDRQLNTQN